MDAFLWFYFAGLAVAALVGEVFYLVIGPYATPFFARLMGEKSGHLWGRSFRLMVVVMALVGGLSTQWYGCGGYTDYSAVKDDPRIAFQKATEQVAGALRYADNFVIIMAALGAISLAIVMRRR